MIKNKPQKCSTFTLWSGPWHMAHMDTSVTIYQRIVSLAAFVRRMVYRDIVRPWYVIDSTLIGRVHLYQLDIRVQIVPSHFQAVLFVRSVNNEIDGVSNPWHWPNANKIIHDVTIIHITYIRFGMINIALLFCPCFEVNTCSTWFWWITWLICFKMRHFIKLTKYSVFDEIL